MTIRCSRCGSARFFFTLPGELKSENSHHHGACCAGCGKPISARDLVPRHAVQTSLPVSHAR
ncbi:hypothetical protein D8B20_04995 [Candidatus Pantoea soli]|uniref:Uncharacterized protein n=1 Tax=Candidatus Pantoea soli TaxID=3098669 RepID=A0A518XAS4_9GAMM|nr:hypothetical protein D8B20_04995 [Pantoea soli]